MSRGTPLVGVRLDPEHMERVNSYQIARDLPNKSEAVRELIMAGCEAQARATPAYVAQLMGQIESLDRGERYVLIMALRDLAQRTKWTTLSIQI